jgi:16S rRNA (guanine527-N7)-methyltransferase
MTHEQLQAAGYDIDATAHARLAAFVDLLLAANERVNLTGVRDVAAVWQVHVCDSLALLPLVDRRNPRRLIDVGTGGGIPGVLLAAARPDLHVTLLDATKKKTDAVRAIITDLQLANADVVTGRAEALARDPALREAYDVAVARAVASLAVLAEYCAGFARIGGWCWFPKSTSGLETELAGAKRAAGQCGLGPAQSVAYRRPGEAEDRVIVTYPKRRPLPAGLPREVGRPRKQPL